MKRHLALLFIAPVSAAGAFGCSGAPPTDDAQTFAESITTTNVLKSGQSLGVGQYLLSQSGGYKFIMQGDGNAVVYKSGGVAVWATGTNGKPGKSVRMNTDGDLQVLDGSGQQLWHSNTSGHTGAYLVLHNDGSLVLFKASGDVPVWWTGAASGASNIVNIILQQSHVYHVSDANLADMVGVAACESGFDPAAVSPAGAMGLFQFMPSTWQYYRCQYFNCNWGNPYDAVDNAATAAAIIGHSGTFTPSPWEYGPPPDVDPYLGWVLGEESQPYCHTTLVNAGVCSIAGLPGCN